MANPSLDPGGAFYSQVIAAWPLKDGSGNPEEIVSATTGATLSGGASWDLEGSGYGVTTPTQEYIDLGAEWIPAGNSCTFVFRSRLTDGAANPVLSADPNNARFGTNWPAFFPQSGAGLIGPVSPSGGVGDLQALWAATIFGQLLTVSGQAFDGTLDTFVIRVTNDGMGNVTIDMWRNGSHIGTKTGTAARSSGANNLKIGAFDVWAGANQFTDLFVILDGTQSDPGCATLSADPWAAMFIFPGHIKGAAEIDLSARGNITVDSGDVSGEAVVSLAASGAIFSPSADMSGTAAVGVAASGRAQLDPALVVRFEIWREVNAPLVVSFDISPVEENISALTVLFDIIDENPAALEVSFEILQDSLRRARLDNDVQAPVARVSF